jgi:hypothetical protein
MIETPEGLENVEAIAATPGLDGLYIGPSDLTIAVGGSGPADPSVADAFEAALARVRRACEDNGIAAGLHTRSGEDAAKHACRDCRGSPSRKIRNYARNDHRQSVRAVGLRPHDFGHHSHARGRALPPDDGHGVVDYAVIRSVAACCCS